MRPLGAEQGCAHCPHMLEGSSWDGVHCFCVKKKLWTNLLHPEYLGDCLFDLAERIKERNARLAEKGTKEDE